VITRHAGGNMPETLLIVSHVVHYRRGDQLLAYGPYAREVDIWADLFGRVVIAAPCRDEAPPGHCVPFTRPNISIAPQIEAGGDTWRHKLHLAASLPSLLFGLSRAMAGADAIHVRCPGNLGLLGVLLAPVFSRRVIAKYAGQWNGFDSDSWAGRVEKYLLRSRWWCGPVTVYGEWQDQPPHVIPFFTSMMTTAQVEHATRVAAGKRLGTPLRVLFAGLLEPRKRVHALLDAAHLALGRGMRLEVVVLGDGPEHANLVEQARGLGLSEVVRFLPAVPFDRALEWYEWADCLVLPSRHSEGWPKVIAEAMSYGVLCVGVDHGQLQRMLRGRGILLREGSPAEIADSWEWLVTHPEQSRILSERSSEWARQYSLDGLREALNQLLTKEWRLPAALTVAPSKVFG